MDGHVCELQLIPRTFVDSMVSVYLTIKMAERGDKVVLSVHNRLERMHGCKLTKGIDVFKLPTAVTFVVFMGQMYAAIDDVE